MQKEKKKMRKKKKVKPEDDSEEETDSEGEGTQQGASLDIKRGIMKRLEHLDSRDNYRHISSFDPSAVPLSLTTSAEAGG